MGRLRPTERLGPEVPRTLDHAGLHRLHKLADLPRALRRRVG